MNLKRYSLAELALVIACEAPNEWTDIFVTGLAPLETASAEDLSFIAQAKYRKYLHSTKAAAVIATPELALELKNKPVFIHADPYLAYAKISQLFAYQTSFNPGIHPSAVVAVDAKIAATAYIGPQAVIEEGVVIGEGVFVGPACIISAYSHIGKDSRLQARVTVYHHTHIGERAIIHSGVVLGADGFGFAPERGRWIKIEQLGRVLIGDDVEIGANTTIDRGALGDTEIHNGVKLDNQIQIGHNVVIGEGTAIAGCTGIAGSSTIGRYCRIAGLVGIAGHIQISDAVVITGMSMVTKSILKPGIYSSGVPLDSHDQWVKNAIRFKHLDELAIRVAELEARNETL